MTDYVTKQVFHTKLDRKKLTVCTTLKHPIKSLENKEVLRQNVFISFRRKSKSQINVFQSIGRAGKKPKKQQFMPKFEVSNSTL